MGRGSHPDPDAAAGLAERRGTHPLSGRRGRAGGRPSTQADRDWLELTTVDGTEIHAVLHGDTIRFHHLDGNRIGDPGQAASWPVATTKTPEGRGRICTNARAGVGAGLTIDEAAVHAICAWADVRRPGEIIRDSTELNRLHAADPDEEHRYASASYPKARIARVGDVVLWEGSDRYTQGPPLTLAYRLTDATAAARRFADWKRRPPDS